MKIATALVAVCLLLPALLHARQYNVAKERAKELSNQNNVRQGVAPPTQQPAATATAPTPAAQPSPSLARLKSDLAALQQPTLQQKQKLAGDLVASTAGTAKPSTATAGKLAEDIGAAFAEKPLSEASRARLAQELDAVLNPAKYPQAKWEVIFTDVQAIFQDNGLSRKAAVAISDDVKAIAAEVKR